MTEVRRFYSCDCKAITITSAAYWQMTVTQRKEHRAKIRNCPTCKRDKRHG